MNKELEAVKEIENTLKNTDNLNLFNMCNLKIIKTAIRELHSLQETRYIIMGGRCSGKNYKADILLKLKAFEIIKNHKLNLNEFDDFDNYDDYCEEYGEPSDPLPTLQAITKNEFDIVKEALL